MDRVLFSGYMLVTNLWVQEHVQGSQHQRDRAKQLDQDVERWASSILEGIANGIANNTSFVWLGLLAPNFTFGIEAINHFTSFVDTQVASFDVLLGIVPGTTTIVEEEGEDDATHGTYHQHTSLGLWTKDNANEDGGEHSHNTRENHSS